MFLSGLLVGENEGFQLFAHKRGYKMRPRLNSIVVYYVNVTK